jgi:signal transduction histidine kinase
MTGLFWLDWAIISISLFNTMVLLWLGLTVFLNADRRSIGVWLLVGGSVLGTAFFISHTAILGQSLMLNLDGLNFWWQFGWIPVTLTPFSWYIVVLWYGGFWSQPRPDLFRRHIVWLGLVGMVGGLLIGAIVFTGSIPSYEKIIQLDLSDTPTLHGIPLFALIIPAFMVACTALSLDVLLRPGPSKRPINEIGRQRSRPWLLAVAVVLLAVSLLVVYFIGSILAEARFGHPFNVRVETIGTFDLVLSALIAAATLMLGQAVVAYEVFTGRVLPRRELRRHWQNIILLALGYAAIIGWSITAHLRPIYSLLLAIVLVAGFYSLYSWRSFVERERFVARLRPFVSGQRLLNHLLNPADRPNSRADELFRATCIEVLGTECAQLTPFGPLSPLVGPPLTYPAGNLHRAMQPPLGLPTTILPLTDDNQHGYSWVIPLWAERGLIGALFIGQKIGGGLYTQEEIEIAQASGERIIDMLAGEQMTSRLLQLQRKRLTETRVMDLHTRRALHDTVLPNLHTAILQLSELGNDQSAASETIATLTHVHGQIAELIRLSPGPAANGSAAPDLTAALRELVSNEFSQAFDRVAWEISDEPVPLNDPLVKEVLLGAARELMRNAAIHGRGGGAQRPLKLIIAIERRDALYLSFEDNGVGLSGANKPADTGGSQGGLELHRTLLAVIGADCLVETSQKGGTQATIIVPWHVLGTATA